MAQGISQLGYSISLGSLFAQPKSYLIAIGEWANATSHRCTILCKVWSTSEQGRVSVHIRSTGLSSVQVKPTTQLLCVAYLLIGMDNKGTNNTY